MVQGSKAESSGEPGTPERLYEGYVFDLDGTIYLGDELLPGAERLILKLRELGRRVIFLSNNESSAADYFHIPLGRIIELGQRSEI